MPQTLINMFNAFSVICQHFLQAIFQPYCFPDCEQQKLKFFDMNAEVFRQICAKLKDNVDTGMGYVTLAGHMGFSKNMVTNFEREGDPCENMFRYWTDQCTENNVLRLKELVEKLGRADILEMLNSELQKAKNKCGCSKCVNVKC